MACTFTLEQVGSLKQIDLKEKQPAGKGVVPVMRGIYSLDADSLQVCFGFCQTVISGKSGEIRDFDPNVRLSSIRQRTPTAT